MLKIFNITDDFSLLSVAAQKEIKRADKVFLQSEQVACLQDVRALNPTTEVLDRFFEQSADFSQLCADIAEYVAGNVQQNTVFLCLGGTIGSQIVSALRKRMPVEILTGAELAQTALCFAQQHFDIGILLRATVTELEQLHITGNESILITNITNSYELSDVKLKLSFLGDDAPAVFVGTGIKTLLTVSEIDRQKDFGVEACVCVPAVPYLQRTNHTFYDLVAIMDRLRAKDGCPWDVEQTHQSIAHNAIEEAYEVADAIERGDIDAMYDELGDLLLQVVFHAKIAAQDGEFDLTDICTAICTKLIRRHPHIFGDVQADTANKVLQNWEQIKRGEKGISNTTESMMDIPAGMSALMRAQKIQKKAAGVGFDFADAQEALKKVDEELCELREADSPARMEEEAGDLLFAVVNVLRLMGFSGETALMHTNDKFIRRFSYVEKQCGGDVRGCKMAELDRLWEESKKML